jgi:hypothetical protein
MSDPKSARSGDRNKSARSGGGNKSARSGGKTLVRVVTITAIITGAALVIAAAIGFATGGFAPGAFGPGAPGRLSQTVDESASLPLSGIDLVSIVAVSEHVSIVTGTGSAVEARLHGTVHAGSREAVPHLAAERKGSTAEIRADRAAMNDGLFWSDLILEVRIPAGYGKGVEAKTVSGEIDTADGAYTGLTLKTTSGAIEAGAVRVDELSAHTTSGAVLAASVSAQRTDLGTVSGDVSVKSLSGEASVSTTSGEISLAFTAVPPRLDAGSMSGSLRVSLPADAQFVLDARSTSGDVKCAFPITIAGNVSGHRVLTGTVGAGTGVLSLHTVSGDIRIEK